MSFSAVLIATTTLNRENGIFGRDWLRAQFTWADLKGPDARIARLAASGSPAGAIWVVPPDMEVFRLLAKHPVVIDFTSMPFGDTAMREWRHRILTLYGPVEGDGFQALKEMHDNYRNGTDLAVAAAEFGAEYAVLYRETPWETPALFENEVYKAVRITPPE